jgi:hypothetical protein
MFFFLGVVAVRPIPGQVPGPRPGPDVSQTAVAGADAAAPGGTFTGRPGESVAAPHLSGCELTHSRWHKCLKKKKKNWGICITPTQPLWVGLGAESRVCYPGNTADRQPQWALMYCHLLQSTQAGELSENSLISEIFVSTSEKNWQVFLLNAYAFRDFFIFWLNFQRFFLHCVLHPV